MRAAVLTSYGDPEGLELAQLPRPEPNAGEALIRVHAATVTKGDTELRTFALPLLFWLPLRLWLGLFKPRANTVLGMEVSGVVEAVGDGVTEFRPGDAVFGPTNMGKGGNAEYAVVQVAEGLAHKPDNVSFEQAAGVSIGAMEALGYLRKGGIERDHRVLIRGASGSIGTFAVQLAKHFGAHVTGVCPPQGLERAQQLGADEVIDYTKDDFTKNAHRYDLILDVVGGISVSRVMRSLTEAGRYVRATVPGFFALLQVLWIRMTSRKRFVIGSGDAKPEELRFLAGLLESGEIETVVDRCYPLDDVAAAHQYVEQGHKQGNVILTVITGEQADRARSDST